MSGKDSLDASSSITSKTSSWLRRSLVARESAPAVPQHSQTLTPRPSPAQASSGDASGSTKARPNATKRATWTNGVPPHGAPIPILPSIKPISPLSAEVTAQANVRAAGKIGRQLSQASHGNHYADVHRQEAERALNGQSGLVSPAGGPKEGFFSHLRKRARRLSGRYQTPMSPNSDDVEASAGCSPWASTNTRQPMSLDQPTIVPAPSTNSDYSDLDKALQHVRSSVEGHSQHLNATKGQRVASNPMLKRHHSVPHGSDPRGTEGNGNAPISSRTRRAVQNKSNPSNRYETPNEEEELLSEVLASTQQAVNTMDSQKHMARRSQPDLGPAASYLTPSSSAKGSIVGISQADYSTPSKPMNISKSPNKQDGSTPKWPTPPYDENDWASSVAASLMATQKLYR